MSAHFLASLLRTIFFCFAAMYCQKLKFDALPICQLLCQIIKINLINQPQHNISFSDVKIYKRFNMVLTMLRVVCPQTFTWGQLPTATSLKVTYCTVYGKAQGSECVCVSCRTRKSSLFHSQHVFCGF